MGRFVGVDVGYDCLGEGEDEPPGTIAVCKGAGVDAGNQGQGRQFGVLLHWGWQRRVAEALVSQCALKRVGRAVKESRRRGILTSGVLRQIGKYAIILSFSKKQRSLLVG